MSRTVSATGQSSVSECAQVVQSADSHLRNLILVDRVDELEKIVSIIKENNYGFKVDAYQGLYNAITRSAEPELIPTLRKHGISYYTYNPLGGGFFSGKITSPDDPVEAGSRFDDKRWQGAMYRKRYYRDEYFKVSAESEELDPAITLLSDHL